MTRMSLTLGRTLATLAALAIAPAAAAGAPGDVALVAPGALEISVSGDGSAVAFVTDLQLDRTLDRNEGADVYVAHLDLEGGTTFQLISKGLDSQSADGSSRGPEISADGSAVAFFSRAANLVDGDSNDREDVFVADVATGELRRANLTPLGGQADVGQLPDARPSLSADGAVIAFADTARELAPGTPLGTDALVYRREVAGGSTEFVDVGNDVSLSGDGKTVAYQRGEQVLADAGDEPELVSRSSEGAEGDGFSGQPDVNDDGSLIAFTSEASNLAPEDTERPPWRLPARPREIEDRARQPRRRQRAGRGQQRAPCAVGRREVRGVHGGGRPERLRRRRVHDRRARPRSRVDLPRLAHLRGWDPGRAVRVRGPAQRPVGVGRRLRGRLPVVRRQHRRAPPPRPPERLHDRARGDR